TLARDFGEFLGSDGEAEVGMVQMNKDLGSLALRLVLDGADIGLDGFLDGLAAEGLNQLLNVGGVEMDRQAFGFVANLFALDHEEPPALLDQRAELAERLETDFIVVGARLAAGLDPAAWKARLVLLER